MSLELIDPYPWFLNKPVELLVNDHKLVTKFTATQWVDHWRPLLARLLELWLAARPRRFVVAIAGPPGSGKSVFSEQLNWVIRKGYFHKEAFSDALSMDGFHYPNAYLESHFRAMADGTKIPLAWVKGQPDTIDTQGLRKALKMLAARPPEMDWPGYSRRTHDVVPRMYVVHTSTNLVFVDGIYLLLNKGDFAGIADLFDLRIYVEAPAASILSNLMERHMRGGKSVEQAKEWVKRTDLPNARIAEGTRFNADVVIQRNTEDDISEIRWKGEVLQADPNKKAAPASSTPAGPHIAPPVARDKP